MQKVSGLARVRAAVAGLDRTNISTVLCKAHWQNVGLEIRNTFASENPCVPMFNMCEFHPVGALHAGGMSRFGNIQNSVALHKES